MITRQEFEVLIPAMADPTGEIYDLLSGHLLTESAKLDRLRDSEAEPIGPEEKEMYQQLINEASAYAVAYRIVPQLDLVATPTGFGVVSNGNVAPASAHRVAALRELLRRLASNALDALIHFLLSSERLRDPEQHVARLLYSATDCRAFGVGGKNGQQLYGSDYEDIAARLTDAEHRVQHYIGYEMYDGLLRAATRPLTEAALAQAYRPVARLVRELIATIYNGLPVKHCLRSLYAAAKKAAKEYPEEYSELINMMDRTRYHNEQSDPCYFSC